MRTLLRLSLITNAGLILLAVWLGSRPARISQTLPANVPAELSSTLATAEAPALPVSDTTPSPAVQGRFSWSQLESADYRTYAANLRRIGCPEETIRDIVAADLDNAYYANRRHVLEQSSAAAGFTDSVPPEAVATEMRQLGSEEFALIAQIVAAQPGATPMASVSAATSPIAWSAPAVQPGFPQPASLSSTTQPAVTPPASVSPPPSASANPGPNNSGTMPGISQPTSSAAPFTGSEGQSASDVGPTSQPLPSDSAPDTMAAALRAKWELARRNADYSLRGLLGSQRYLDYVDQQYLDAAAVAQ